MAGRALFREDIARYGGRLRWSDRALWSIAAYRAGRRILEMRNGPLRRGLLFLFLPWARMIETLTKVSLPAFAQIGGGFKIGDGGMIFIHSNAVIGRNCTVSRGVTIGNAREDGATPIIGDNVEIGAYAQVLGGVRIGDGAKIASMSVVLKDVPAETVAIGIPAEIWTGELKGA